MPFLVLLVAQRSVGLMSTASKMLANQTVAICKLHLKGVQICKSGAVCTMLTLSLTVLQLENTTPGVPEDLFKVRDGRRLQVTKQASTHGQSGVLLQTPEASCKQTTELAQQSSPPKRRRVLTSRMMTSDMYLRCDALRGSFSQATTSQ